MSEAINCPKCNADISQLEWERQGEYTGGGYLDYLYEYYCTKCEWGGVLKKKLITPNLTKN